MTLQEVTFCRFIYLHLLPIKVWPFALHTIIIDMIISIASFCLHHSSGWILKTYGLFMLYGNIVRWVNYSAICISMKSMLTSLTNIDVTRNKNQFKRNRRLRDHSSSWVRSGWSLIPCNRRKYSGCSV